MKRQAIMILLLACLEMAGKSISLSAQAGDDSASISVTGLEIQKRPAEARDPTKRPGDQEALVYFYRPEAIQLWNLSIYADGRKVCDLHRSQRYTHTTFPGGTYVITSHPTFRRGGPAELQKSQKSNVDLEIGVALRPGQTDFIEYRYAEKRTGLGKSEVTIDFRCLSEDQAMSEIAKCSYERPEVESLATSALVVGKSNSRSGVLSPVPPSKAQLRYVVERPVYLHLR